ncbi:LuxR C-terminal-related transcriptional regulator [Phytohabitans rumicis]|uniref:DNA-binding response regulator n=1 Tax=Phytohabitans rumicis TaxID=1076125 RepID=A0A6V8L238_9ACTN|nr:response regulator transcription factor [Phytohabitans rumicis]GFJ86765.1 DNA-binding response regulator [Phytohabitans rumicis]
MTITATPTSLSIRTRQLDVALLVRNDIVRSGLRFALQSLPAVRAVRDYRSAADVAATPVHAAPDVLILSLFDGIASLTAGALAASGTKTLVLIEDARAADNVLSQGLVADGFLLQKDLSARALDSALRALAAGELPMPTVLAQQLLARAGSRRPQHISVPMALTPRERETLTLLTEGLSNKQIARRLKISDHGAKRLVAGVLLKLGCTNRTAAVVTAIRHGLVEYS